VGTLTNATFDTGTQEWSLSSGTASTIGWSPTGGRGSPGCIELVTPGSPNDANLNYGFATTDYAHPVVPGQNITINWWFRMITGSPGMSCRAAIYCYDENYAQVDYVAGTEMRRNTYGSGYIHGWCTMIVPWNGRYVKPATWLHGAHQSRLYADDFSWNYVPPPPPDPEDPDPPTIHPPTHEAVAQASFFRNGVWRYTWGYGNVDGERWIHGYNAATQGAVQNASTAGADWAPADLLSATVGDGYQISFEMVDATAGITAAMYGTVFQMPARAGSYYLESDIPAGEAILNATKYCRLRFADALANYTLPPEAQGATSILVTAHANVKVTIRHILTDQIVEAFMWGLRAEVNWPKTVNNQGPYQITSETYGQHRSIAFASGQQRGTGLLFTFNPNGICNVSRNNVVGNATIGSGTFIGANPFQYGPDGGSMAGLQLRVTVASSRLTLRTNAAQGFVHTLRYVEGNVNHINLDTPVDDGNYDNNPVLIDWTPVSSARNIYAWISFMAVNDVVHNSGLAIQVRNGSGTIVAQGLVPFWTSLTVSQAQAPPSGGGGGCVCVHMYAYEGQTIEDVEIGEELDIATYDPIGKMKMEVKDTRISTQPCWRIETVSGIVVEASDSTPMQLRDGSVVMFPDMLNQDVLVDDDGEIRWEQVKSCDFIGDKEVAHIFVSDNCFFAGEDPKRRIATHNQNTTEKL